MRPPEQPELVYWRVYFTRPDGRRGFGDLATRGDARGFGVSLTARGFAVTAPERRSGVNYSSSC